MRLWTLHPKYLDARGLVALWREALLAQKVLRGLTKGYVAHPQLIRFRQQSSPTSAIAAYLAVVHAEACERGYCFDRSKIGRRKLATLIAETDGQLQYEWEHLQRKLKKRNPAQFKNNARIEIPEAHPLFQVVSGCMQSWERV